MFDYGVEKAIRRIRKGIIMRGNKFLAGILSAAMVLSTMTVPIFAEGVISEAGTGVEVKAAEGTSEGVITEPVEETTKNETSTEGETAGEKLKEATAEGEAFESTLKEIPNEEKLTEAVNSVNAALTNAANAEETTELTEGTTTVAKIGEVEYKDLATALKAATAGQTVELASDITLTGEWTPIDDFEGTFDGKGYTIKGLKISSEHTRSLKDGDADKSKIATGLFANLPSTAVVKNLKIDGAKISFTTTAGDNKVGVLAGYLYGATVENVTITNSTVDVSGGQYVGGLCGKLHGTLKGCTVSDSTITAKDQVGGFVGYSWIGKMEGCKALSNTVKATEERAGGLIGKMSVIAKDMGSGLAYVKRCTVSGGSATAPDYAGGLIGQFMGDCDWYSITENTVEKITLNAPKAAAFATIRDDSKKVEAFMNALKTKVVDNKFSTALEEAIEAAKISGTFTLSAPIAVPEEKSGMITVDEGTYVFELNNHKLTGGISNMGADVTIKDANIETRYYDGASKQMVQYAAIAAYKGTTTVVESGTFDSTNAVVQAQGGDVTLNDGTYILQSDLERPYGTYVIVNVSEQGSVAINGGTYKMAEGQQGTPIGVTDGTVIINNGTFVSNNWLSILAHPADAADKAVITVNDGVFEGAIVADPGSEITINDGKFTSSTKPVIDVYNDNSAFSAGQVTINGGTFTGNVSVQEGAILSITGGTFSTDVTKYLADGKILNKNTDGTYTVVDVAAKLDNTNVTTEEKVETLNNVVVSSAVADKVVETIKALPTEAKEEISATKLEEIIKAKEAASTSGSGAGAGQTSSPGSGESADSVVITKKATATSSTSGGSTEGGTTSTSLAVTALKSTEFDTIKVEAIKAEDKTSEGTTGSEAKETNIKLPEGTDAVYFDITLTKTTGDGGSGTTTTVTEVETPILLKFTVPDASKVKSVLRYHDGVQEAIPFEKGENNTIMVSAVKFSEYAVVQKATPSSGNAVLTFGDTLDGDGKCEIYLVGASDDDVKNFESGEFKIVDTASSGNTNSSETSGKVGIVITGATGLTIDEVANGYYKIHRPSGATAYPTVETSNHRILLGTLTLAGTGKGQIYAENIKMWKKSDSDSQVVEIKTTSDYVTYDIKSKTETLTIDVTFPNAVENQGTAYQDMTVTISGGDLSSDIVYKLGSGASDNVKWTAASDSSIAKYTLTLKDKLTKNISYTVKVEGAGYRTARYIVNMSDAKTLTFWNNVKTTAAVIETGKTTPTVTTNFLAGDIVKDNQINIYDLSAVVSYFGETNTVTGASDYAKYDLNRDGKIDSKDIAYVLVSWGN